MLAAAERALAQVLANAELDNLDRDMGRIDVEDPSERPPLPDVDRDTGRIDFGGVYDVSDRARLAVQEQKGWTPILLALLGVALLLG